MKKRIVVLLCCMGITASMITGCGDNDNEKEASLSKLHPCEVQECSENGTKEIVGLSGKTEYYCDEHYKAMEDMAERMLGNNSNDDSSESDYNVQEDSDKTGTISEQQESNKIETDNDVVSGSISKDIVSFVSATRENGYGLINPNKREKDGSSLVTCEVKNSNNEFYVQYLVEDGYIKGIWINANNKETVYNSNYKDCIVAMAISFNTDAEIESVTEFVDNALYNPSEIILTNEMVFQFEDREFIIMRNQ